MAGTDDTDVDERELVGEIIRINGTILGLVLGMMAGLLIFAATNWLVIKGGEPVGPHLALLAQFFPGYSVSFAGSLAGFAYGLAVGCLAGWAIGSLYNWLAFRGR